MKQEWTSDPSLVATACLVPISPSLTMNTYSHSMPGVATVAATALDELLRPGQ